MLQVPSSALIAHRVQLICNLRSRRQVAAQGAIWFQLHQKRPTKKKEASPSLFLLASLPNWTNSSDRAVIAAY